MVLDIRVQSRRDTQAGKRLMRKLLKKQMRPPRAMITDTRPCLALVSAAGPRKNRRQLGPLLESLLPRYAKAAFLVQRNSITSTHIRCSISASLRASATFARFVPRHFATPPASCHGRRFDTDTAIRRGP